MKLSEIDWDRILPKTLSTANPAAGADPAVITVPAKTVYRVMGVFNTITTDGNAADRYPYLLELQDGTNTSGRYAAATPITASLTGVMTSFNGGGAGGAVGDAQVQSVPIPPRGIELPPAGKLQLKYLNIQAGDDATAAVITYKEAPA